MHSSAFGAGRLNCLAKFLQCGPLVFGHRSKIIIVGVGLACFRGRRRAFRAGCFSFHIIRLLRLQRGQRSRTLDDIEHALRL